MFIFNLAKLANHFYLNGRPLSFPDSIKNELASLFKLMINLSKYKL